MDLTPLLTQLRAEADPEKRSQILQRIAVADRAVYGADLIGTLIDALDDEDAVVQEWATVALRRCKADENAFRALQEIFENPSEREARRCWSVTALGRMGRPVPAESLYQLYRERRDNAADLILSFAIHWAGKNGGAPEVLLALRQLQQEEAKRSSRPDAQLEAALRGAVLRSARRCLAAGAVTKAWLHEHGMTDLLDKLGETRIKRLIEEERARILQPALSPELEDDGPDSPLVPGRALSDVQEEQYIRDLAEWKDVRIIETRSYVRDQALAREVKKAVGYACQVCGESLPTPGLSRRFVHAHHIEPLSEGGRDAEKNLVVLCPSCHAKVHAREIKLERDGETWHAATATGERRPLLCGDNADERARLREHSTYQSIIQLFDSLTANGQADIVKQLRSRVGPESNQGPIG